MDIKIKSIDEINFSAIAQAQIRATAISSEIAEFRIAHCCRVVGIAIGLAAHEIKSPEMDLGKLVVICHIHDMYKYICPEDHGNMAANWLYKIATVHQKADEWKKACKAIQNHSSGKKLEENIYTAYLYEADKLDHLSVDYIKSYAKIFMNDDIKEATKKQLSKVFKIKGITKDFDTVREHMTNKVLNMFSDDLPFQEELKVMISTIKTELEKVDEKK